MVIKKDICRLRQLYTCTCTGNYNASFYTAERAGGKKENEMERVCASGSMQETVVRLVLATT